MCGGFVTWRVEEAIKFCFASVFAWLNPFISVAIARKDEIGQDTPTSDKKKPLNKFLYMCALRF
jgi:hypothetical protein